MTAPGRIRKRRSELKQKQKRRVKVKKLKARYRAARTEAERKQVLDRLFKIAPNYPIQEFQSAA